MLNGNDVRAMLGSISTPSSGSLVKRKIKQVTKLGIPKNKSNNIEHNNN